MKYKSPMQAYPLVRYPSKHEHFTPVWVSSHACSHPPRSWLQRFRLLSAASETKGNEFFIVLTAIESTFLSGEAYDFQLIKRDMPVGFIEHLWCKLQWQDLYFWRNSLFFYFIQHPFYLIETGGTFQLQWNSKYNLITYHWQIEK